LIGAAVIGLLLQLIVLRMPTMRNAFKLEMLSARGWMSVIVIGSIPIDFNEIAKGVMRKEQRNNAIPEHFTPVSSHE